MHAMARWSVRVGVCALALGSVACSDPRREAEAGSATDSSISLSGSETTAAPADDDDSEKLDVGAGSQTGAVEGGDGDVGCEKVDFLFVIDSSNSMETNQAALIASFPEFVDGIVGTLEDVDDFHVGVVTSDAYPFNGPGCTILGALVTQTGGKDSGMETCTPFATAARFMTEADDLPDAFACAALVGTAGANDEAMMGGALNAISPALGATDACNEGFIREDALLVMVLISDEDDPGTCVGGGFDCMGTAGDPMAWHADVLGVKEHPENVVVLSLTRGAPDNMCGPAEGTELDGVRLMEFAELWGPTGLRGDICAGSFGAFFDQAVGLIDSACSGFIDPAG
jgi:hypothetical protein